MNYSYTITTNKEVKEIKEKLNEELSKEGFGQLFEIPLSEKIKEKLNKTIEEYTIIGICNPQLAYEAISVEKQIGLFLPCNIIIYKEDKKTKIATILPSKAMRITENEELDIIAIKAEEKLKRILKELDKE